MSTSHASHRKPAPHLAPHAPERRRRWWFCFILPTVLLLLCVGAAAVSYSLVARFLGAAPQGTGNILLGTSQERSASAVASNFMHAIKSRSYLQTYNDLDDTLLVNLTADDFKSQAARADGCFAPVSTFQLTSSAVGQSSAQYAYGVTRAKLSRPYLYRLTLQQSQGIWAITAYANGTPWTHRGRHPATEQCLKKKRRDRYPIKESALRCRTKWHRRSRRASCHSAAQPSSCITFEYI
jgi:hypothetical protein